ncbi:hypothetical protein [Nubsella zeaxanthinifaciens]|uniref:hypothetical protein n=1 Tax=Nubsella zeaxanthinifaciens TaxID=392412 RepID=UPI000DE4256C|nr:hypothetical protein [Nubsella zeaxanthinifaciens]
MSEVLSFLQALNIVLDSISFIKATSSGALSKTDTIYSSDNRFTIIFHSERFNSAYKLSRDNFINDKQKVENVKYSILKQNFGWKGSSEVKILDNRNKDTMTVILKNIVRRTYANIDFKKGEYIEDTTDKNLKHSSFFCSSGEYAGIQTEKIRDNNKGTYIFLQSWTDQNETTSIRLLNAADTSYIKLNRNVDNKSFPSSYSFKKNLPDGEYKIYINGNLDKEFTVKKNVINGISYEYIINGEIRKSPYNDKP